MRNAAPSQHIKPCPAPPGSSLDFTGLHQNKTMDPCTALAVGTGAVVAVVGAPLVLGAVGFTSAGITAGSYAATMMSAAAAANGGAVAAGSTVAVMQAAGAAGLSGAATAAVAATGAAVGYLTNLCDSPI
ncbi:interferon alpha-inducible protein 27-like protein 2A [Gasterosteus aculeatus]